jgi:hypothetical protein
VSVFLTVPRNELTNNRENQQMRNLKLTVTNNVTSDAQNGNVMKEGNEKRKREFLDVSL